MAKGPWPWLEAARELSCPHRRSSPDVSMSIMSHGELFLHSRPTGTRYLSSSDKYLYVTVLPFKL